MRSQRVDDPSSMVRGDGAMVMTVRAATGYNG